MKIDQNITLNDSQSLFVIKSPDGCSCLGYDNCHEETKHLVTLMNEHDGKVVATPPEDHLLGTLAGYNYRQQVMQQFKAHQVSKKTLYQPGTHHKVASVLESARKAYRDGDGTILRLFFGDHQTGFDHCYENDVVGFIGRSTGFMRVPLLLEPVWHKGHTSAADYGSPISSANIIRIIRVNDGRELYRCKNYHLPHLEVCGSEGDVKGYLWAVEQDEQLVARFKRKEDAQNYVAFMQGSRLHEPYRTKLDAERDFL